MVKRIKDIEKLIGEIKCSKNYMCYRSGFKALCKTRNIGIESYYECLEKDPINCAFSFKLGGNKYLCKCPMRKYIAENLKK